MFQNYADSKQLINRDKNSVASDKNFKQKVI